MVVEYEDHPRAMESGSGFRGVFEHRLIAEQMIDRPLKEGEHVHHLDLNRVNNSPDNLLVLSAPMHSKLHAWLDKHEVTPTPEQEARKRLGCVRCKVCDIPILPDMTYCSLECAHVPSRKYEHPTKEELQKLLWEKSTVKVAKDLNVSDKAVEKLAKKLGVEKPPRGYWNKIYAGKIPGK